MSLNENMHILILDDYVTVLRILRNLLKQLGFRNVHEASDGLQALQRLEFCKYDLVISDWNMEHMSGYELLKAVRSNPDIADTKFIMVTAQGSPESVIAAKKAGVDDYIIKPFTAAILRKKIEAVFSKRL